MKDLLNKNGNKTGMHMLQPKHRKRNQEFWKEFGPKFSKYAKCHNFGKWMTGRTGEKSNNWTGDNAAYRVIHNWLVKKFGLAQRCENPDCKSKSKRYDYALIHGRSYSRNRKDYLTLCRSCHYDYDRR